MPPPLSDLSLVSRRLAGHRPALFCDYDGTLTPIVERPEEAALGEPMRAALRAAAAELPLAVISGRDLDDVRALVGLEGLIYAGSHGFDIRGPDLRLELPDGVEARGDLARAARLLRRGLADVPGAQVERKGFAVAVHHRRVAAADRARVEDALAGAAERLPALRRTGGKGIFELRPNADWDKGRALSWILARLALDGPRTLPIYLGDDETDEDGFRAVAQRGGIGVLVAEAPRSSAATFRLPDPEAVRGLIRQIADALRRGA